MSRCASARRRARRPTHVCARCASGCWPTASSRTTGWSWSRSEARRMRWVVVTIPGSNYDGDELCVSARLLGDEAVVLWHKDRDVGGVDCVILPGGFSYCDYLQC